MVNIGDYIENSLVLVPISKSMLMALRIYCIFALQKYLIHGITKKNLKSKEMYFSNTEVIFHSCFPPAIVTIYYSFKYHPYYYQMVIWSF